MSELKTTVELDFLEKHSISKEDLDIIEKIRSEKRHRIWIFSEITRVLNKNPKDINEAAMLFSEAKSLMRLLRPIEINKNTN